MICFPLTVKAWGTPEFETIFIQEIEQLGIDQLPLQEGLTSGSWVVDKPVKAILISVSGESKQAKIKAGIYYLGINAGSCCADDPTPVEEQTEYCEMQFLIDRVTAQVTVSLLD